MRSHLLTAGRTGRRTALLLALASVISMAVATSGAQAVVVSDQGQFYGAALVPGTRAQLAGAGVVTVGSGAPCLDPWLSPDLALPDNGLCSHGGPVMHSNETFDLTWDPVRRDWATTRYYVEQFLRDVADGSGTLSSPYALTGQYRDASGRAANSSVHGGGCIDYGSGGGSTCQFGNTNGSGAGHSYPANGCPVTGSNQFHEERSGAFDTAPNDICLTDAQVKGELGTMIAQEGLVGHIQPGHTPLLVLMTPAGVETCLDAAGHLCSANGGSSAQFCSYHSQVNVGGTEFAYVVQPWTALSGCDEPDAPKIDQNPSPQALATDVGVRLVSPLSQAMLAAIVNPGLNGWSGLDGSEINDNGCVPLGNNLDSITVGKSAQNPYLLQREFNNAGVIETDPNAPSCTGAVALSPTFVVPSAVDSGDVVQLDGSKTVSSLIVPNAGYVWSFGDGTTAIGPSVVHSYANGGSYDVKLTVIDRGGNVASVSQTIAVLGPTGKPVTPPPPPGQPSAGLHVHLRLVPEGLRTVLHSGVAVRVSSNERADGIATVSISRSAAKHVHIRFGRAASVVIGRGTVSGIKNGTMQLHLRLSSATAAKLKRVAHVTLTIRLALVATGHVHLAVVIAGRY